MEWKPKPKGDRAAILELEARCAGPGAGRKSPTVFRVPAMYKPGWCGPVGMPRSRSVDLARMRRSTMGSRAGRLSPLPDRSQSRTSFQHGNWFASSLADLDSHWDRTTTFGVVRFHCIRVHCCQPIPSPPSITLTCALAGSQDKRHEQNRVPPVTIDRNEDSKPLARTENRDSFPLMDPSELPPPNSVNRGLRRDKITIMRETCLRGNQTVLGVIQLPPQNGATYAHAQ